MAYQFHSFIHSFILETYIAPLQETTTQMLLGSMQSEAKTVIHTIHNGATNKHVGPYVQWAYTL